MPQNSLLKLSRQVHLYFGLLISPALIFFAFTGCYQTLGLHEGSANYKPPVILASLAQIHKKQTYLLPVRRSPEGARPQSSSSPVNVPGPDGQQPTRHHADSSPQAPSGAQGDRPDKSAAGVPARLPGSDARPAQQPLTLQAKQKQHLPLKVFFVLVSLGLFTSTITGFSWPTNSSAAPFWSPACCCWECCCRLYWFAFSCQTSTHETDT